MESGVRASKSQKSGGFGGRDAAGWQPEGEPPPGRHGVLKRARYLGTVFWVTRTDVACMAPPDSP